MKKKIYIRGTLTTLFDKEISRYHRSVAAGLLSPWRGSFFSSAVVGSSLRGVKAITALRRRVSSSSLLGFSLFSLILFLCFSLGFGCLCPHWRRVKLSGGKGDDACDGCLRWTVVDEISPKRSILSDIRSPKMFAVKIGGALEFRFGREIQSLDLRRWWEAVVMRRPRDTCSFVVEDDNMCPRIEKSDMRGGCSQVRDKFRVFSSWVVSFWPNWIMSFSPVDF